MALSLISSCALARRSAKDGFDALAASARGDSANADIRSCCAQNAACGSIADGKVPGAGPPGGMPVGAKWIRLSAVAEADMSCRCVLPNMASEVRENPSHPESMSAVCDRWCRWDLLAGALLG